MTTLPTAGALQAALPLALQDVRALVFDIFGTVVDWRGSLIRDGQALQHRLGWAADWPALADAWRAGYRPAMARVRSEERRVGKEC